MYCLGLLQRNPQFHCREFHCEKGTTLLLFLFYIHFGLSVRSMFWEVFPLLVDIPSSALKKLDTNRNFDLKSLYFSLYSMEDLRSDLLVF